MNWKWFVTPARPRWISAVSVGVLMIVGMWISRPVWIGDLRTEIMLAAFLAFVASVSVKLVLGKLYK